MNQSVLYYSAALLAATCWAFGGILSKDVVNQIGALRFSRWRMSIIFFLLLVTSFFIEGWETILNFRSITILLISGLVGIYLGDSALFVCLQKLGPRRTSILFATSAPMTALMGYFFYQESWSLVTFFGTALIILGIVLAVIFGTQKRNVHQWDQVNGKLTTGILFGLSAALCQGIGIMLSKEIMVNGADPIIASVFRVGIAALGLQITLPFLKNKVPNIKVTLKTVIKITLSGTLGMYIGMTLVMFALIGGNSGIVSALSSTTPVLVLPLLWIITKQRPMLGAWIGAILTVIGTSIIFIY